MSYVKVLNNLLPCLVAAGVLFAISFPPDFKIPYPAGKRSINTDSGDTYEGMWVNGRFNGSGVLIKANKEVVEGFWTVGKPILGEGGGKYSKFTIVQANLQERKEVQQQSHIILNAASDKSKFTPQAVLAARDTIRSTTYTRAGGCFGDSAYYEEAHIHMIDTLIVNGVENYFESNHYEVVAGEGFH